VNGLMVVFSCWLTIAERGPVQWIALAVVALCAFDIGLKIGQSKDDA